MLRGTSSFRFFFYLVWKKRLPISCLVRALFLFFAFRWNKLTISQLHQRVFNLFLKGRPLALFTDEVQPFLDRFLLPMIDVQLISYLEKQLKEGNPFAVQENKPKDFSRILLLSSSPNFLVGAIAKRLHIENWHGTEYAVDKESLFCNISKIIEGQEKLRLARLFAEKRSIPPQAIAAYSDSDDDLPLLNWAGTPFAVRPNKALLKAAIKNGWKVIYAGKKQTF